MPSASAMTLRAPAKLNLALSVGAPIPDGPHRGYHPIASWFVPIDLHDTIELAQVPPGTPSKFTIDWAADAPRPTPIDWPIEKDLAVRAHALLQETAGRPLPVALTIHKRIPVGGGLGGGSSDAAAALLALNRLFTLHLPIEALRAIAAKLGSDIAFFLDDHPEPRSAFVSGFGEHVEYLDQTPAQDALLLIPPFGCPTAPVYRAFDSLPSSGVQESRIRELIAAAARSGRIDSATLFNDLAPAACAVEPRLTDTLPRLRSALGPNTPVHITGSGSTMFVLPNPGKTNEIERAIRQAAPDLILVRTHLLSNTPKSA